MLIWQFYTYNEGLKQASIEHPTQEHFWFTNGAPAAPTAPVAPAQATGADVQQTAFTIEGNTPSTGSMTCHVTLKNEGGTKAVGIQVKVRPYRGASKFDEDVGRSDPTPLSDDDPISQFGDWVNFPDLAPGESSTQSVVFMARTFMVPGTNPKPEILFQTDKAQATPQGPHQGGG